jgi:hypothetical protein
MENLRLTVIRHVCVCPLLNLELAIYVSRTLLQPSPRQFLPLQFPTIGSNNMADMEFCGVKATLALHIKPKLCVLINTFIEKNATCVEETFV